MASALQSDLSLLKRLFRQAKPYWPHLLGVFALDMIAMPVALLMPVPLMLAVNSVLGNKPLPDILQAVLPESLTTSASAVLMFVVTLSMLIALLGQIQKLIAWLLQTYVGEMLALEFRSLLLLHAQCLSLAYHDTKGTADSIYRIQYDAPAVQWVVLYGITPFLTAGFTLIGMIGVTATMDWQLALVALAISPILYWLTQAVRIRLRYQWRDVKNLETSSLGVIQEVLAALRVVKAFGQEEREHRRFFIRSRESMKARVRVELSESIFSLGVGMTIAAGTAAVLYLGVSHVLTGALTLGQLLLVMSYLAQLYAPLQTLGQQVVNLQGALASAERAYALLDESVHVTESPDAKPLLGATGAFKFERVTFSYDGQTPVFRDVAFEIPAGSRVGIFGRTGAGKTTLVNLLSRLYDPSEGRVLLDDTDLRGYKLADLRNQFSIVLQEPVLFSTSIAENIAYGCPSASRDDIIVAAKTAAAHEFIEKLPAGYDTQVGERGLKLSGGQRQRLSLARAFLKDAPILILDEPMSSVDTKTEEAIMEAMERLMKGRTTFMIAHQLLTLQSCNMVLQLDAGRLTVSSPSAAVSRNPVVAVAIDSATKLRTLDS